MASTQENRKFLLKERPEGLVDDKTFELQKESLPNLADGEFLVQNLYLSIDPTNRIWITDVEQYMEPVQIGEVMRGLGIGKVIESNNKNFPKGQLVSGPVGWQDFTIGTGKEDWPFTPMMENIPLSPAQLAGAAGMTGLTAYFGLLNVAEPKEGETIVISAGAGAVGSIVGQIAKIKGLKVVGIAGSDDKCKWLVDELGFDAAINYKKSDWKEQLKAATPDGIDINFENVGGEIMNEVFSRMNLFGRVSLCGMISSYNDKDDSKTRVSLSRVLMKRLKVQGFIITDFAPHFAEATAQLAKWLVEGKIKSRETIIDGLENAPSSLNKLFEGANTGKLLVKVSS